jgi:hypothetical protein
LLFQVNVTAIIITGLFLPLYIPYSISYSLSALAAVHTWFYVRGLPES